MIEIIKSIFLFACKLVFIEWMVELIRMSVYAIINNMWPQNPYEMDKWTYFEWFINCLETTIVAVMLYFQYPIITIILVTYLVMLIIKQSYFYLRRWY